MFVMDSPNLPPDQPQVMLVQASQSQDAKAKYDRTIGVCHLASNPPNSPREPWTAINSMSPAVAAGNYFNIVEKREVSYEGVRVEVLESPKHGRLQPAGGGSYHYIPDVGYLGKDRATFLVEMAGKRLKVVHVIHVLEGVADAYYENKKYCPNGEYWKTSQSPDAPVTAHYTMPSELTSLFAGPANVNLTFADLSSGALGQATGQSITLDPTAAGHNWYIDYTPYLNEEYLPTADSNVWKAKSGSEAEGKMDMLSVLLHEYGHVLGIEHSK